MLSSIYPGVGISVQRNKCCTLYIVESEKDGSCSELNPGHLTAPAFCYWIGQPPALTVQCEARCSKYIQEFSNSHLFDLAQYIIAMVKMKTPNQQWTNGFLLYHNTIIPCKKLSCFNCLYCSSSLLFTLPTPSTLFPTLSADAEAIHKHSETIFSAQCAVWCN